ncbi:hypothetical protein CSKR_105015, partial [Clonorchis sinensis]
LVQHIDLKKNVTNEKFIWIPDESPVKNKMIFSRITLICKSVWFCERLTWNPAESPVFDVSRQLNVLHQAASCSSCYDIRDIAIHCRFVSTRLFIRQFAFET